MPVTAADEKERGSRYRNAGLGLYRQKPFRGERGAAFPGPAETGSNRHRKPQGISRCSCRTAPRREVERPASPASRFPPFFPLEGGRVPSPLGCRCPRRCGEGAGWCLCVSRFPRRVSPPPQHTHPPAVPVCPALERAPAAETTGVVSGCGCPSRPRDPPCGGYRGGGGSKGVPGGRAARHVPRRQRRARSLAVATTNHRRRLFAREDG